MTDDATLTDFTESDPSDADGDAHGGEGDSDSIDADPARPGFDDSDPDRNESDDSAVEGDTADDAGEGPTGDTGLSTYGWGEYTCHRCASENDRVWREDGELVCPDCKSW